MTILVGLCLAMPVLARAQDEPDYPHGDYQDDCTLCHRSDSWSPAVISPKFRHAPGRFPLAGAHGQADCRSCHATLDFRNVSDACVSCHQDVHNGEMGTDCGRCHTPRSFIDRAGMSRLHSTTRFPLSGSHLAADCEECHRPVAQGRMQFVNTPVECQTCHLTEYQATSDPDHAAANFPLDCEMCHAPTSWRTARFNHANTSFPLTGAHRSLACESCHAGGYDGAPADCYACHRADYEATTDPDHAAAGFATDCAACHGTTRWDDASLVQHDSLYFPIYSGRHRGRWSTCADCHLNPASYAQFTCINCHAHDNETDVTNHHQGVSGFTYDGQACYTCHPRGNAE